MQKVFNRLQAIAQREIYSNTRTRISHREFCFLRIGTFADSTIQRVLTPLDMQDLHRKLASLFPDDPDDTVDVKELLQSLAVLAAGGEPPLRSTVMITICSATPSTDGRLSLKASMLSGFEFVVSCDTGVCARNVSAQIREEHALNSSVVLVTSTGVVLQEGDVLPEALEEIEIPLQEGGIDAPHRLTTCGI